MSRETGCFTYELEQEISKLTEQNKEMLEVLKECVEYQCSMCTGDRPEDCDSDGVTCDYHKYKAIIQKIEGE